MVISFPKKLLVTLGVAASCFAAGSGVASADQLTDTTCTYPQVIAALNVQDPVLAQKLGGNAIARQMLTHFLSEGPAQRAKTIESFKKSDWGREYFVSLAAVAPTCNNY